MISFILFLSECSSLFFCSAERSRDVLVTRLLYASFGTSEQDVLAHRESGEALPSDAGASFELRVVCEELFFSLVDASYVKLPGADAHIRRLYERTMTEETTAATSSYH